jgi:hypothetical protein
LIVVGQSCWAPTNQDACYPGGFKALAYDPRRNRWTTLPTPPTATLAYPDDRVTTFAHGWTGRLALFDVVGPTVTFNPSTHRWSTLDVPRDASQLCATSGAIVALFTIRSTLDHSVFSFAVRGDDGPDRWQHSATFAVDALPNNQPAACTPTGAIIVMNDGRAAVFDRQTLAVRIQPATHVHGSWYSPSAGTSFAPLAPDRGHEIALPSGTTNVIVVGQRVYAIDRNARLSTLLRH